MAGGISLWPARPARLGACLSSNSAAAATTGARGSEVAAAAPRKTIKPLLDFLGGALALLSAAAPATLLTIATGGETVVSPPSAVSLEIESVAFAVALAGAFAVATVAELLVAPLGAATAEAAFVVVPVSLATVAVAAGRVWDFFGTEPADGAGRAAAGCRDLCFAPSAALFLLPDRPCGSACAAAAAASSAAAGLRREACIPAVCFAAPERPLEGAGGPCNFPSTEGPPSATEQLLRALWGCCCTTAAGDSSCTGGGDRIANTEAECAAGCPRALGVATTATAAAGVPAAPTNRVCFCC